MVCSVAVGYLPPTLELSVQSHQLATQDLGLILVESTVIRRLLHDIVAIVHAVVPQASDTLDDLVVGGQYRSAVAITTQDLRGIEGVRRGVAKGADDASAMPRSVCLRAVLEDS